MYEFLKTEGKLRRLLGIWGGLGRAERSGSSPDCCPRRGLGRAGAAPCPPVPTSPGSAASPRSGSAESCRGLFYCILFYSILFRFGLLSSLFAWWEVGLPLHSPQLAAAYRSQSNQTRCRRVFRLVWTSGTGIDRAEPCVARCPSIEGAWGTAQLLLWTESQFFWLGSSAIHREITSSFHGVSRQS